MKKSRNVLVIFSVCLFLGSMTSCKAIKKAKKKRCKCPTFSYEDKKQQADEKAETIPYTFEETEIGD